MIEIYTDGSIRRKVIITAAVININGKKTNIRKEISRKANNFRYESSFAEIHAINNSIEWMLRPVNILKCSNEEIKIYNDNQSCIQKFNKKYKLPRGILKNLTKVEVLNSFLTFIWIPREKNKTADKLCNNYFI